jgi:hypothetical protein
VIHSLLRSCSMLSWMTCENVATTGATKWMPFTRGGGRGRKYVTTTVATMEKSRKCLKPNHESFLLELNVGVLFHVFNFCEFQSLLMLRATNDRLKTGR